MQLILSAISAGGLIGASNQYLCLLIVAIAAKLDWINLSDPMVFMEEWWFIAIVAVFWLITIAPAYATSLSPGVMNVINTVVNAISGLAVPISAAILSLASIGVIVELDPELRQMLETLQLFNADGGIGITGFVVAGSGAVTASALTGSKFLAKPAISTATGTAGTTSAPIYATLENVASIVLMGLFIILTRINPWLLVGLLAVITLLILGVLGYAIYQLWKLGKGIGKVLNLIETQPKAGLAVVSEFFVWGSGWLIWEYENRGLLRLVLWFLWLLLIFLGVPAVATALGTALAVVPPLVPAAPLLGTLLELTAIVAGLFVGLRSASGLLCTFDGAEKKAVGTTAEAPAAS